MALGSSSFEPDGASYQRKKKRGLRLRLPRWYSRHAIEVCSNPAVVIVMTSGCSRVAPAEAKAS
jgi:hypothetical protein